MAKQYISIIRLFQHLGIAAGEGFNFLRTKKQLQAEFSISKDGFIAVEEYSYSRQDVFEEVEHPDFEKRLGFHRQLWQSPQLLQLLEKNTADTSALAEDFKPFWGNRDFDEFFSPYFALPFNHLSRNLLAQNRFEEAGQLLAFEDFLLPAEREEAFRPLRFFLEENHRLLRNVNWSNYKLMRPKMTQWIDAEWWPLLNALPDEFQQDRDDIVVRLVNLGVAIQKMNRRDCRKMSYQLVSLSGLPDSLRNTIASNHAIYTGSGGSSGNSRWGGFAIAWLIFLVLRVVASDGCKGSSSSTELRDLMRTNYHYYTDSGYFKRLADSIKPVQDTFLFKVPKKTGKKNAAVKRHSTKDTIPH